MSAIRKFTRAGAGVIYRQETGLQGYYARVVRLSAKELVGSFVASTVQEGPDCHPVLTRSRDGGTTWNVEGPVDRNRPAQFPPTETGFISADREGALLCVGARWRVDPADPDQGVINPRTVGMQENEVVFRRSADGGRTWTTGRVISKPLACPWEVPTGIVTLNDGTQMLSFATWKRWDGSLPYGHSVRIMKSRDRCATWENPITLFHDTTNRVGFWEGRLMPMDDQRLLATCWAHDWNTDADLANHYVISEDQGATWTEPKASPVYGQANWPLWLGKNTFLFVYNHRRPPVGVRAQIARLDGEKWETQFDDLLWSPENKAVGTVSKDQYAVTDFQFGLPSAIHLDRHSIMVCYWCVVNKRAGINFTLIDFSA